MYQYIFTGICIGISAAIDIRTKRVYRVVSIFYLLGVLIIRFCTGSFAVQVLLLDFVPGIVCLLISFLSRQAFGYGDSILIFILGISLGFWECMNSLIYAFGFAGIWGMMLIVVKKESGKREVPFVPFLALGILLQFILYE